MRYTAVWDDEAENAVIEMWINAGSELRHRITLAVAEIDRLLGYSAETVGESRESELVRMLCVPPLAVTFEVRPGDCIANVISAHLRP